MVNKNATFHVKRFLNFFLFLECIKKFVGLSYSYFPERFTNAMRYEVIAPQTKIKRVISTYK